MSRDERLNDSKWYVIADVGVRLTFNAANYASADLAVEELVPSLKPFESDEPTAAADLLFELYVDDATKPVAATECKLLRTANNGNGDIHIFLKDDGGYQFIIKNIKGKSCCLLITDKAFVNCRCALKGDVDMRAFGLNTALMLLAAFAGSSHDLLLIHSSVVARHGWAYAFIAESGTGKSTQSANWMKNIADTQLLNDDNPIVRIIDGTPYIYGSPWSGKTPCYRNRRVRLGAVAKIVRAQSNHVETLHPVEAFSYVLEACSSMMWDKTIYRGVCDVVKRVVESTPVYALHCLPDNESAIVCQKVISRQNE